MNSTYYTGQYLFWNGGQLFMKSLKDLFDSIKGEMIDWRSNLREIGYAVLIVILINAFFVQNYQIPTGSMIPNLMPGDRLFANRFVYGIKIPFTDGLVGWRLPKIKEPDVDDLVVFRAPASSYLGCERRDPYHVPSILVQILKMPVYILCISPFDWDPRILVGNKIGDILTGGKQYSGAPAIGGLKTVDLDPRKEYVKRVLAKGGDTVEIREQEVYLNGQHVENKYGYFKYGKRDFLPSLKDGGDPLDFYGPIYVPKKGDTMVFKRYSGEVEEYSYTNYDVFINGEAASIDVKFWYWVNIYDVYAEGNPDEFTFDIEENYFFCVGDNRDESCDSRMWGLVPYHLIKGQPNLVWFQAPRPEGYEKGFLYYLFIKQ